MFRPGAAVDCAPLNWTLWPTPGLLGENTKSAFGGVPGSTWTGREVAEARPRSDVTVSVTLNEPVPLNECETVGPASVVPSPKSQVKAVIERSVDRQPP